MIPPCLTLSNIRYISRVKWSNPGKEVAPSSTLWCSSYWKGSLLVALNNGCQIYLLYFTSLMIAAKQEDSIFIPRLKKSGGWFPEKKFERLFSTSLLLNGPLLMKYESDLNKWKYISEYRCARTFHPNDLIFSWLKVIRLWMNNIQINFTCICFYILSGKI